jgi:Icc-related predicted phosphoesterase
VVAIKIAFVGDIHGRVFHTLAVLAAWQKINEQKLDLIIQVGDFGAYPEPDNALLNSKFVKQDPHELDFCLLLKAEGELSEHLRFIRQQFKSPIYFIRGNHEDFDWLDRISHNGSTGTVRVDPYDLFHYVIDGTVRNFGDLKIAFLGGIETPTEEARSINEVVYNQYMNFKEGDIDILITHDAPYGIAVGFKGQTQGSVKITELIHKIQPKYLIAGHYHHMNGPNHYGKTTYMGLNILVPPLRSDALRRVQPGSIAIMDTERDSLSFVTDDWLSKFDKDFDFNQFVIEMKAM